jgi:alpha-L-rhamnosidase
MNWRCAWLMIILPLAAYSNDRNPTVRNAVTVTDLRTEYRRNPLGIDIAHPRLSWKIKSNRRGTLQSAYQVRVTLSSSPVNSKPELVWDSGRVASDESIQQSYLGPPLQSRQHYIWQVRVWNES